MSSLSFTGSTTTRDGFPHEESEAESDSKTDERLHCSSSSLAASKEQQCAACCKQRGQPRAHDRARYGEERDTGDLACRVAKPTVDYSEKVQTSKIGECGQCESWEAPSKIEGITQLNKAAWARPICIDLELKERG
jgi:hypothetical protein